jgi:hypothetical protein
MDNQSELTLLSLARNEHYWRTKGLLNCMKHLSLYNIRVCILMHFMTLDFRLIASVPKLCGVQSRLRNDAANICGFSLEIWINRMTTRPSENKSRTCVQNIERPMNTYWDRIILGLIRWSLNFQQFLRFDYILHLLIRSKVQDTRLSPNHSAEIASLPIIVNKLQLHAHCTSAKASYRVAKTWSYNWVDLHWPSNWSSRIRPWIVTNNNHSYTDDLSHTQSNPHALDFLHACPDPKTYKHQAWVCFVKDDKSIALKQDWVEFTWT